jgi:hypothetical protein
LTLNPNKVGKRGKWHTHLEDLALSKGEHDDAAELGERDAGEHRRAHGGQRMRSARLALGTARCAEAVHQVRAELHRDAHCHHLHGPIATLCHCYLEPFWRGELYKQEVALANPAQYKSICLNVSPL